MNEFLFFVHVGILLLATRIALKMGKSALMALISLQFILANLFLPKQITLFFLTLTPTDAYTLSALVGVNLVQEYYGKAIAKKLIRMNFFFLIFFTLMAMLQVAYIPSPKDMFHPYFTEILAVTPRIFLSSIFCFFLTQRLDVEIFEYLRKTRTRTQSMTISLSISQAVDTILFTLLALTGIVDSVVSIIFVSYFIKMLTLSCTVPFTKFFPTKEALGIKHEV